MKNLLHFVFLLIIIAIFSCGGEVENKEVTELDKPEAIEKVKNENRSTSGIFSWDNIRVYKGAILESTEDCPAKWAECEKCEHRVYVTDDDPKDVCDFYKDEMKENGWNKIVFQIYPEGSCMGSWLSADSDTRVFLNAAQRRSDNKTFIAITMGNNCPD
jgi:hypothetical protein